MANSGKRPLKVFLCHASGDKPPVRDLYKRLTAEGVDAWLDKEKLLPGQDWRLEIPKAVREADVVVVCLSDKSITKEGYVQKEIKFALDIAEEKPEGTIFLIPARLEDCVVPERLGRWHWVDLYEENGFIQLLRSLKLRAEAVDAAVEPAPYADSAQETDRKLEQWYTEGLAAFYTEDWDRACQRFQSILSERPNHQHAAEKLEEAERQRSLSKLYEQASAAVRSEDWGTVIHTLEELSHKSAEYKDAAQLLRDARKQKQLRELYAEAKALHAGQQWEAVVRVFQQISLLEPNYPDADGLLPSAQREVAELKRLADLNEQYGRALREMDAGNWYEARRLLESVHKSQTGFLETEKLLKKVEGEIAREEQKRQQNNQVNTLYEQAHGLFRSKKWRNALDKMEEIRKLDDHFPDTDRIAEKAKIELGREEQEAERQNKLAALYAEAVRLLKDEKYQEALGKWGEVRAIDPKYPDRQWVARTARRKLGMSVRQSPMAQPGLSTQHIGIRWLILLAALGFGLTWVVTGNMRSFLHISVGYELEWGLRGLLQGLITALILKQVEKDWKGGALLVFAVCWATLYPISLWTYGKQTVVLMPVLLSLASVLSIYLSSLLAKQSKDWRIYAMIFAGWTVAWMVGNNTADYLTPLFRGLWTRYIFGDIIVGGVGLWITISLLKSQFTESTPGSVLGEAKTSDTTKLLLTVFLGIVAIRAIWGFFRDWLDIWQAEFPTFTQVTFYFVLGGFFGAAVAYSLRRIVPNWTSKQSLLTIGGWAIGLSGALLAGLIRIEFLAVVMVFYGVSTAAAIAWANPSVPPIKITLIFLCWALASKYGGELGNFLETNLSTDYAWYFADAVMVLLGLLGTMGIYEYASERLVKLASISVIGFALGNYVGTVVGRMLLLPADIEFPIQYALMGLIAGGVMELPSRNWKKILLNGGLFAATLVIGYLLGTLLPMKYIGLRNIVYGAIFGIVFGLSTRRISVILILAILGMAIFTISSIYIARLGFHVNVEAIIRGAMIGLVLGFGYAYLTKGFEGRHLQQNEK